MSPGLRAAIGLGMWVAYCVLRVPDLRGGAWAHALLLWAALVLVPLALELFREEDEPALCVRLFAWSNALQLPAAAALVLACWIPAGPLALAAAVPWAVFTGGLAMIGVLRLRRDALRRQLDGLCADAALLFAAVGGAWTLADRSGYSPLGFSPDIVALTAVHFHFAGLLLPLFAGLVQRELFFWRLASRAAVGVVLGVPALAVGITFTQLRWGTSFEAAAGCGLALAGMLVAILQVRIASDSRESLLTRGLLALAGVSLFVAMIFAAVYALRGSAALVPGLGIPQMRMLHGTLNAFGFGLCGVLAWRRLVRARRSIARRA